MWRKHFVDACGRMHDQHSSDNDSDADLGSLAEGHVTGLLDLQEATGGILPSYTCTICFKQFEESESVFSSICRGCIISYLLQTLQWAKAVPCCAAELPPAGPLVSHWQTDQRLNAAAAALAPAPGSVSEERPGVWERCLGSGASSSGEDSDWEGCGGGGPVLTARRRRHAGRAGPSLCRRKPRGLLRGPADRPPPLLRAAGGEPAGDAGGRSPLPSPPADQQDRRAAAGRHTPLPAAINGEPAGDGDTGAGPGGTPTDGGGGPSGALKTVIDSLPSEPDRTGDDLENVSDDEGSEDASAPPDCPPERVGFPPEAEQNMSTNAGSSVGGHSSLDDISDEETPAGNGVDREAPDSASDGSMPSEDIRQGDPAPTETERRPAGDGVDTGAGAGWKERAAEPGTESPATGQPPEQPPSPAGNPSSPSLPLSSPVWQPSSPGDQPCSRSSVWRPSSPAGQLSLGTERVPDGPEQISHSPLEIEGPPDVGCARSTAASTSLEPVSEAEGSDVDCAEPTEGAMSTEPVSDGEYVDGVECSAAAASVEPVSDTEDSCDKDCAESAAATVGVSDVQQEEADKGTDVEDELSGADALQDRPIDSHWEMRVSSSSSIQKLTDVVDECQTPSIQETVVTGDIVSNKVDPDVLGGVFVEDRSDGSLTAVDHHATREDDLLGGDERVASAAGSLRRQEAADVSTASGAGRPASPAYSPVMSPASGRSLDSAAAAAGTPAGGHCALGVADASDVSSDEELVRGESGRPAEAAADWRPLPVESISSPESFGPDQEEPGPEPAVPESGQEPGQERDQEPESEEPPAGETAPAAAEAAAEPSPAAAPAPLLCLGTEQISDNEEDGFDDGMEEGEIPSERPPTPPPPAVLPPATPLPLPELQPELRRPLDDGGACADSDLPEGDYEEGEIPSVPPPASPESPEEPEEAPAVSPPPAAALVPQSPTEPPLDGDYEEGEIVEEPPSSPDEPAEAREERAASAAEEAAEDGPREDSSPAERPTPPAVGPQLTTVEDDDAPDVDEEVRDFVVSEKTITDLERDEGDDVGWKKISRSARDRNYRDGKPTKRALARSKEAGGPRQGDRRSPAADAGRRGKKRDIQRYDVRKVVTERKMRAQENQERAGRSPSSSSGGSRSPERAGQSWRRSRSPSRSRSPGRRYREHRRRSRERRSPPRWDRSRHSVPRYSPDPVSHTRHSLSRSPQHQRTLSPAKKAKDKSRERKKKRSLSPSSGTKKLKKRKDKLKKDGKKKKKRPKSPISKAVIVDGDNLVVSVNFSAKEHRDRLGTKSRVVRREEREPSIELSPARGRPVRTQELRTPSKDKRPPAGDRDREVPRRDRAERARPPRAERPERELSPPRQRPDARKENKDPKQSARVERKKDISDRRSTSPRPARGSKRQRSVTPPRGRRSQSPRVRAVSPRPAPRARVQSPRNPGTKAPSPPTRAASPQVRTPSSRRRAPSPRPRPLSPRDRAASPRARSRSRSSSRPRKYPRRSRSGSRSSSWSRSSASSESPMPVRRRPDSVTHRRPRRTPDLIDLDVVDLSPGGVDPIVITDSETEAEPATRPTQARATATVARPAQLGTAVPASRPVQARTTVTAGRPTQARSTTSTARPTPAAPADPAASASRVPARSPRGPKTPPEPAAAEPSVRFSLSSKLAAVRMITNPLQEEDEDEPDSPPAAASSAPAATAPAAAAPRGPSTPPDPPPADAKFGDQYDPFEPTHSPSGTPDSPPSPDALASPELEPSPAPEPAPAEPPPPPAEQRERTADKPADTEKRPASHTPAAAPVGGLFAGLPPPSAASLLSSVLSSVLPDTSRPAPSAAPAQNGQRGSADVIDMDVSPFSPESPNSPDSREGDDLFEPPRPSRAPPPAAARRADAKDRFEAILGGTQGRGKAPAGKKAPPGKPVPAKAPPVKPAGKQRPAARGGRAARRPAGRGAADLDDTLRVVDDVPNSAVEMQFLKKLNRQERVIEEVKLVLKPFYHKRTITKEQYKETLRKSVPKICHSKSGEINPKKIHSLIISYVKRCKYINKKNHVTVPNPGAPTPVKGKV